MPLTEREHSFRRRRQALVLGALGATALVGNAVAQTSEPATAAAQPSAVYMTMEEIDWRPLNPSNPDGPTMSVLWGDPTQGPYGAYQRYPAGSASPLHSFSTDQRIVMIQGTTVHWTETDAFEDAKRKPRGGYMIMPAGVKHYAACEAGEDDCIVFVTQDGPFDFTVAK